MIITVGGLAGTGTTTTAELLSEKLGIPFVSSGSIFRAMAEEKGMSVLEFSEFAESNDNIDKEIDKRQAELAKSSENLILEGRLSAYFVEADLKLWLMAPLDVRAQRISQRESKSVDVAKEEIKIREESEALRYLDIHNIDISNLDIYDLMINTDSFWPWKYNKNYSNNIKGDIMAAIEVGRVCVKTAGREAGEKCAIVEIIDENFVEVIGESVKNRRCNIAHLEPTADSVDVSGDADSIKAALADL